MSKIFYHRLIPFKRAEPPPVESMTFAKMSETLILEPIFQDAGKYFAL